jgi:hypothetical protein
MSGPEPGTGAGSLILDAENWQEELLPDLSPDDREFLSEIDQGIIFDALVEFADRLSEVMQVRTEGSENAMSADAPWLVPGTRIHIRAGASARETVKRLVRMATVFAIVGVANPAAGFVGLTVDLVLDIFERTSRLSDVEVDIVRSLIELRKSRGDSLPTEADLRRLVPNVKGLTAHLNSLKDRGIITGSRDGWKVAF